jgi:hypothetical protein
VQNKQFSRVLGSVLHRPSWLPTPSFMLRIGFGEMADILLTGQRVVPAAAQKLGFEFRYPELRQALQACMPL